MWILNARATYRRIAERNEASEQKSKAILDIGTATGNPLYSIIDSFKDAEVVGIDIDPNYVPACQKLFKNHKNVTIKHLNFYDLDSMYPDREFDTIIFGSSFMLMPDQVKAIELAKSNFWN
jgi:ubiquinone/menaquinone biosynthesis C-methylase UbiE